MKLDYSAIGESIKKHRKIIFIVAGLLALLLFITWFMDACPGWLGNRKIDQLKENVNAEMQNANLVNVNLANLKIQEALKANEVERLEQELQKARNELDQAKNATNGAVENVQKVENSNFTNSSLSEAEKNRCRAFNGAPGCP